MTDAISSNAISRMMMGYVNGTAGGGKTGTASGEFSITAEEQAENAAKRISKEDSTVTDFKRRNPSKAKDVDKMLNAGKKVLEMNGASEVDTTKMSMAEYKQHITKILDSIPFDASRMYDEETIFISEAGWEQMKNDPEYEAWVIGYNKVNRSVPNPFAAMGFGAGSSYCIENFGASIEEHHGVGFSKTYGGSAAGARSLYQAKSSGSGGITKRAPQADAFPPKDYDLKQQQEKARRKKKKQQQELEELFFAHKRTQMMWQTSAQTKDLFAQAQQTYFAGTESNMDVRFPASLPEASTAYEAATALR